MTDFNKMNDTEMYQYVRDQVHSPESGYAAVPADGAVDSIMKLVDAIKPVWQPASTIPKDGTPVFVAIGYSDGGDGIRKFGVIYWGKFGFVEFGRIATCSFDPNHIKGWMPVPQIPEEGIRQ